MKNIVSLSFANAASSLHYFLVLYIASSYLGQFLPDTQNGIVFSIAAALMIVGFIGAPSVLSRFSIRQVAIVLGGAGILALLLLATNPWPSVAVALIVLHTTIAILMAYTLDLLLENATAADDQIGRIRGLFLTSTNVVLVASPLLIGMLLDSTNEYSRIFLASAATLAVFVAILAIRKRSFVDRKIDHPESIVSVLRCLMQNKGTRSILMTNLLLQSFYIWASIYIPLYLHDTLGISWELLGPLFALMLLPFLLIELPMGFIEDRIRGTRFIMVGGFIVLGLSFMALSFVAATTNFGIIAAILITTRIGAALIEITAETSFFRIVDAQDIESVGFFRMTRPLSMLGAPLIGSLFLISMPLQSIFIPLGIICLFGIPFALDIKDAVNGQGRTPVCPVP